MADVLSSEEIAVRDRLSVQKLSLFDGPPLLGDLQENDTPSATIAETAALVGELLSNSPTGALE